MPYRHYQQNVGLKQRRELFETHDVISQPFAVPKPIMNAAKERNNYFYVSSNMFAFCRKSVLYKQ
jgi:hypothetical protein